MEVKSRRNKSYGLPQSAVTPKKQRQVSKGALSWLAIKKLHGVAARFDVIAVMITDDSHHEIEHIQNAFELNY